MSITELPLMRPRRGIITNLESDAEKAEARRAAELLAQNGGIYPLQAPGMPSPGPDFVAVAKSLGEEPVFEKIKVKQESGKNKTITKLAAPGDQLVTLMHRALREPGFTMPVQIKAGAYKDVTWIPGHIWGENFNSITSARVQRVCGPRPANVMVIGKHPGYEEVQVGRNFFGETSRLFVEVLRDEHVTGTPFWYVTNLLKFQPPDGAPISARWLADNIPLLHQELRLVRPRYILCVGSDASKALLGKKYGVEAMEGRVIELEYPLDLEFKANPDERVTHKALVMTVIHPAAVSRNPDQKRQLENGVIRFNHLQNGKRWDKEEADIDHRTITTLEELMDLLKEIASDPRKKDNWIAVDAEWHGEHPQNKGAYVRTIQFAWRAKCAAAIVWNDTSGKCAFFDEQGKPAHKRAVWLLNKFFADKRIIGHFLVADLEWLVPLGLTSLLNRFRVPLFAKPFDQFEPWAQKIIAEKYGYGPGEDVPPYLRAAVEGGHDTGLGAHAIEETAKLGLETLTIRYCATVPRYDVALDAWKASYCKERGIKAKDLEGYGPCPNEIIIPYGNYDADATYRLAEAQWPLLDSDYDGNNVRESFWESMLTVGPILEMHRTGIPVDRQRLDYLTAAFMKAKDRQERQIREWANWPAFNIRSVMAVREFLFGEALNGKKSKDGGLIRIRPGLDDPNGPGKSLGVPPLLDTSKPPKRWADIAARGQEAEHTPGTGKAILAILAQDNLPVATQINWIRDYRFLDQVLKSILRPPKVNKDGTLATEADDADDETDAGVDSGLDASPYGFGQDNLGGMIYEAGLGAVICYDGRVRTHLYPTTETKRWRSARPNLQNISKRRDPDYTRLLGGTKNPKGKWIGGEYKYKLRSLMHALPGHVLVEADFKGAELYIMAIMSGDPTMIDHATRNQLDEDDPDYYDIHSNVAIKAFNLPCAPTKKGLEEIGKIALRVAAKNVIFGVAYGRMAKAIALQCKEEGNPITLEQAQQIIDTVFQMYPGLVPFFAQARARCQNPGWLCGVFGAFRRFSETSDRMMLGEFERQAQNWPIQNAVASAMDRVLAYMEDYRERVLQDPDFFKFALQMHDAGLWHVPYCNVKQFVQEVLPYNMCNRLEIYPTNLAGEPLGTGPFHMGIDIEVSDHWGEQLTPDFCNTNDIPLEVETPIGLIHIAKN